MTSTMSTAEKAKAMRKAFQVKTANLETERPKTKVKAARRNREKAKKMMATRTTLVLMAKTRIPLILRTMKVPRTPHTRKKELEMWKVYNSRVLLAVVPGKASKAILENSFQMQRGSIREESRVTMVEKKGRPRNQNRIRVTKIWYRSHPAWGP